MNRNFILEQSRRDNTREAQITPYKRSAVRGILTLILLLATLSLSAQSYSPCYTNNMANGDAAFKQGKYSEAKTYYANAKQCNGGNPSAAQQKINSCDAKIKAQREAAEAKEKQRMEEAEAKQAEEKRLKEESEYSPAQRAYVYGNRTLESGDVKKAIELFQEAANISEIDELKVDSYYMLARSYYLDNEFPKARQAALSALKINPQYGKAFILIGDLYASSENLCKGILLHSNNWAAADKYLKAAAVDPSCAGEANERRKNLTFPNNEEKFEQGLSTGVAYTVGCWINERTTVR